MAPRRSLLPLLGLCVVAALSLRTLLAFVAPRPSFSARSLRSARAGSDSGKLNVGKEVSLEAVAYPAPIVECDSSCIEAIEECLYEGCSVDAMMKLDAKLAEDEEKVAKSVEELLAIQKKAFSEENASTLAWLKNFLSRSGSLRAQLSSLKGVSPAGETKSWVQQLVKAASVAFGGGREGSYPKVGVSSYTA
eukprot:CAMPEP_0170590764 /NCGR_PEP_ID=MMETSP0224-20130122/12043_1 /TAXON_ID=285029 /ORGANISM="Togula jolla, Strain CCCM 725" /LENGTH=191 /DNA_ID=CAMNT_0010914581 /DNA_START=55 /DNA_END=630 /DNA_ORIENTATION=+